MLQSSIVEFHPGELAEVGFQSVPLKVDVVEFSAVGFSKVEMLLIELVNLLEGQPFPKKAIAPHC